MRNLEYDVTIIEPPDHRATSGNSSVCSEAEYDMVEDEDTFREAPWRQEQTGQTFY